MERITGNKMVMLLCLYYDARTLEQLSRKLMNEDICKADSSTTIRRHLRELRDCDNVESLTIKMNEWFELRLGFDLADLIGITVDCNDMVKEKLWQR